MENYWDTVKLIDLVTHTDDRGWLIEVLRQTDKHFTKFGQIYSVGDMMPGTVRAYHRHFVLWDWFFIANGSAKFVLLDNEEALNTISKTKDLQCNIDPSKIKVFHIHARTPKILVVPPTIWHGWMSLEPNTVLISTASEVYNREKPDEERIRYDIIGKDVWKIQYK